MKRRYAVTIEYREPTWELHAGVGPRVRRHTFVVWATSKDGARAEAVAGFREVECQSWVGWRRDIESVGETILL